MIREKDFVLRPYTKKELAMRFFPDTACPRTATAHLVRWIKRCTPLSRQLEACGYRNTAKWLSAREVRLIVEYLGEP